MTYLKSSIGSDAVRGKFYRPSLERRTLRHNSNHTQEMNEGTIQNDPGKDA